MQNSKKNMISYKKNIQNYQMKKQVLLTITIKTKKK